MYIPEKFNQPDVQVMHKLMQDYPLATLVTHTADGLNANHIPMHLSTEPVPYGVLRGHVARANPVWQTLTPGHEVLSIFNGPDAYITPAWYATKQQTGKVVPTWNYAVVHAYGQLQVIEDTDWLRTHLSLMTAQNEAVFPQQWQLSDAPEDFIERLMGVIIGIEIVITRLSGKWKVNQNQPPENQKSVIEGLKESDLRNAEPMRDLISSYINSDAQS